MRQTSHWAPGSLDRGDKALLLLECAAEVMAQAFNVLCARPVVTRIVPIGLGLNVFVV